VWVSSSITEQSR